MDNSEFPSNSEASRRNRTELPEEKSVERITTGKVTRRRKSLRKRFTETFVAGDARNVFQYVLLDIALPAAQDLIIETGSAALERIFKGESRRRRGGWRDPRTVGETGYIAYNRMNAPRLSSPQRALSRQARANHDFDEIVLDSRTEAEEVLDRLYDLVRQYDSASVADLYELVGLNAAHTDHKWGWTELPGAGVSRIRDGYVLDLPEPSPLV